MSIVLKRHLASWNGIDFNGSQPLSLAYRSICTKPSFWFYLDVGGCDLILHVGIVKLTIGLDVGGHYLHQWYNIP